MESAPNPNDSLTPSQRQAVAARGNVLVMAGAGTGKTKTLIARCLDCLERDRAALDELLIVTFTEAAAAEMRQRLRKSLEEKIAASPDESFWQEQTARFDLAHIGTLHGFCLRLVREHFHELGLDPQLAILDEGEARQLADETLAELFQTHYAGEDEFAHAFQNLVQLHGGGRDENIRALVLRLHHYSQSRPAAAGWLADELKKFSAAEPTDWQRWLLTAIDNWRSEWLTVLENLKSENVKAVELTGLLQRLGKIFTRELAAETLAQIVTADVTTNYPKGQAGKLRPALGKIFEEATFLATLAEIKNGNDPLAEDWSWVRGHMATGLRLAQEFGEKFSERKRADGVLDFHDLEQFALKLLWDFSADKPTSVAEMWRAKLKFVFVDEYQDINAAQDKIIAALARDGGAANRFLVGDVKQSIYRFRLADPKIFRNYAQDWRAPVGQIISLSENFRSRAGLLKFVNSVCGVVMHAEVGGVAYDAAAELQFGAADKRAALGSTVNSMPRAELLVRLKPKPGEDSEANDDDLADLDETTKEARLIALRLKALAVVLPENEIWDDEQKIFRAARFSDMAILLRSPRGKAEIYAKEFERAGIPLSVKRGGFFNAAEILDLRSLLQLLDNPLQDVPCIAVLRSPLVGLSLDELAEIRLAAKEKHFWTALNSIQNSKFKIKNFLERFSRWRKLAKMNSLSECLEAVLAETLYADWLRAQPRGAQRAANVAQFVHLAESFDQFQRQGLFRFLKFIGAQEAAESEPEVSVGATENAVRLMSIHQSKGLEFPIVALPDLAKGFNEQDLHAEIIFDEVLGLCPKVKPPERGGRYPSLPHWLAQRRQKRELRGEELRLLYVALTRARDTLVLSATLTEKIWLEKWTQTQTVTPQKIASAKSFADWLGLWFAKNVNATNLVSGETPWLRWRLVADEELNKKTESGNLKPETETTALEAGAAEKLRAALGWDYPQSLATKQKAKASVTELRRAAEEADDEAEQVFTPPKFGNRQSAIGNQKLSAAATGTAHHKFLEHVALDKTSDLAAEAARLVRENYLSVEESAALDLTALAAFWNSPLGKQISSHAAAVRRELPFTARFTAAEIAEITGKKSAAGLENEFIIVQGVADLVVLLPTEIWLVDFKTDAVRADELAAKLHTYTPQLKLYAAALEKIFPKKVSLRALHFLAAHRTETL